MTLWDIAIVGAGPSGSYAAARLAERGLKVLLLEEHETVGEPRHCTGILGQEAYDQIPDLPRDMIQSDLKAAWLVSPSGHRVRTEWFQGKAVVIDRAKFDQSLALRAVQAGATLQTGSRVDAVQVHPEDVELHVSRVGGKEILHAKLIVVASGISYRLHSQVGLRPPSSHLMCAQLEVQSEEIKEVEVYIGSLVAPGSFAWAVPLGDGRLRVGVTAHANAAAHLEKLLSGPALGGRIQRGEGTIRKRPVPIRPVSESVNDRVLLLGDAAGQVKPTTGGGIYYGLLGAREAAEVIGEGFLLGRLDRSYLTAYERRWRKLLRREIWFGRLSRYIFEHFSDAQLSRLVSVCENEKVSSLINQRADFDWHSGSLWSFLTSEQVVRQLF